VFFLQYWRASGDRFFAFFAVAFAVFAVNRVVLGFLDTDSEARPVVYLVRLLCFLLIAAAIFDKNRRPVNPPSSRA
jgi:hypothetical protein